MEALGACTGDSVYRAIEAPWRLYRGFPVQGTFAVGSLLVPGLPCTGDSLYSADPWDGAGARRVEPVGGDLGVYTYRYRGKLW